ncbi:hypothetical protein HNR74_002259 [Flammeovirga kamogawensis]|nr:hypothetical protein [Flammeovirga kamogawensis]
MTMDSVKWLKAKYKYGSTKIANYIEVHKQKRLSIVFRQPFFYKNT